ncbi:MAG TPA: proline--tRNA ligase [Anaerolineales bacterium]|nr:proline--tRNA ligase [Anaerolineales bacterium]HRQ91291.1 proline--tRNA ligase [Anaerolineales bacterium]
MKMSHMFGTTMRQAPSEAETASHQLLVRAGFIRQLGAGIYSLMPMGKRSIDKIENIMRAEMNAIGGQELLMPVVHPADLWQETGRWYQIGDEMSRFKDRKEHDMVLAMTHEEVVADLARREVQSYKQLPMLVYHIQTKWRDDPRPRAGLIRVREFTMKDSYSLDADEAGLDVQYRAHYQAYFNIFRRAGLPVISVGADVGMMGGSLAHEYMYLTPVGEDTLVLCDACGYRANRQIARVRKEQPAAEAAAALEKVATPAVSTIEALANFLSIPKAKTAKAVFMTATFKGDEGDSQKLVFAVVRGDMEVNETKLTNAIKAAELRPAHEEEIRAIGAAPGYASPIGLQGALIVVDDLVEQSANLVAGANEEGFHYLNTNYGRDYKADIVADIVAAEDGHACVNCGKPVRTSRGVEVGNIFKLGTRYSASLGANFLDAEGAERPVVMGSYGIGSGRMLACIAEEHNDDKGLIWPITTAPYEVHLVSLRGGEAIAAQLYEDLRAAGLDVLFDDRDESPGVKFNDADLIGLPIRLTVSERSLQAGGVEFKLRREADRSIVPQAEAVRATVDAVGALLAEVEASVTPVPFED